MLSNFKADKKLHLFADAYEAARRIQATPPLEAWKHPFFQRPNGESFIPRDCKKGMKRRVVLLLKWNLSSSENDDHIAAASCTYIMTCEKITIVQ